MGHNNILANLETIVFDFDGVLTNNMVYVDQNGREMVCCSRADGLAFDVLKKTSLNLLILSSERNEVVKKRAEKLSVDVLYGCGNKKEALLDMLKNKGFDVKKVLFIGNDLNDYEVMQVCGYSACPHDSHPKIIELADYHLSTCGGNGVAREVVENVLGLDMLDLL